MDDGSAIAVAETMISNRVRDRTATAYRRKLHKLGKWLKVNGGEVGDDDMPVLPLDEAMTLGFLGELVKPRTTNHVIFGPPRKKLLDDGGHVSSSTAGGFKIAIVWLYTEQKVAMSPSLNKQMNLFISGYKKSVGDLKQQGEMKCFEGKRPLTFEGYKLLSRMFFGLCPQPSSTGNHRGDGSTFPMGIFGWTFTVTQWNLIARYFNPLYY